MNLKEWLRIRWTCMKVLILWVLVKARAKRRKETLEEWFKRLNPKRTGSHIVRS